MRFLASLTLVLAFSLGAGTFDAVADPVGHVKRLRGTATIDRGGQTIPAEVGSTIEAKDRISTGERSAVGITLTDDTRLSAGPNSVLAIEEYVFNSTTHDGTSVTRIERGTMTVSSGKLAKRSKTAMKVRTPQAVLGVRGTKFLVKVEGD